MKMQALILLMASAAACVSAASISDIKWATDNVLKTYEEAVGNCTKLGGILPTGRDKTEIEELRQHVDRDRTSFWLNGAEDDDGVYRWQENPKERINDDLWYEGHEPWCHKCCRVTLHFNDDINDGKLTAINCDFKSGFICMIKS